MKSADPNPTPESTRQEVMNKVNDFTVKTEKRVANERKVAQLKEHYQKRQALLDQGASDPGKYMRALMSSPTMFPINTTAVPVTDLSEDRIDEMTDSDIEAIDDEAIHGDPSPTPEVEHQISQSVTASSYWLAVRGMLAGLNSLVDEFENCTSPEERMRTDTSDRAIELMNSIANKLKNLQN